MTIKEIASEAGVSIMTVSNVINNKQSKVSKKTFDRVAKIIEKHQYVPNLSARSLSANSSKIIAIFITIGYDIHYDDNIFNNPYFSQILGIIETLLRQKGYFAMIRSVSTVEDVNTFLQNWNIDGTIFIYPHLDKNLDELYKSKSIPMIFLDSYNNNKNLLSINIKDSKGTFLSTKYLINKGHRKIAFVANYENNQLLIERFLGYKEALESANIEFDENLIFKVDPNYEGGIIAGKRIADNKEISAAVTTADICAIGILEGARLSGLSVPEDLSVIGYDNLLVSTFTTPKLTTINQHIKLKGEKAVELLFDRLNKENKLPNKIFIDVDLIERQSVISKK